MDNARKLQIVAKQFSACIKQMNRCHSGFLTKLVKENRNIDLALSQARNSLESYLGLKILDANTKNRDHIGGK